MHQDLISSVLAGRERAPRGQLVAWRDAVRERLAWMRRGDDAHPEASRAHLEESTRRSRDTLQVLALDLDVRIEATE